MKKLLLPACATLVAIGATAGESKGDRMADTRPVRLADQDCCSVFELRQYTLHPGKRDVLIELFDREFVETQEAVGMRVVGQLRDVDDPNRFVWIRGFRDMQSRPLALAAFYDGPVWKTHREQANATMIDSSNVLLLRPVSPARGFPVSGRPAVGARELPSSLVVATVYSLNAPMDNKFLRFFEQKIEPALRDAGAAPVATLQTESAENNFPRLPVREGENVFVWFACFRNAPAYDAYLDRLSRSQTWLQLQTELRGHLKSPAHHLRLRPTARSALK